MTKMNQHKPADKKASGKPNEPKEKQYVGKKDSGQGQKETGDRAKMRK